MEYFFTYGTLRKCENNEFSNYLNDNSIYLCNGFMYGDLYEIDGYPAVINTKTHNHIDGDVYLLKNDIFDYLDNYEGSNYERRMLTVHTENATIHCWVYILRKI